MNRTTHYTTYPFALSQQDAGGLPSVLLKESRNPSKALTILTTDEANTKWNGAEILAASSFDVPMGQLFKLWFGTGHWQWLHPDAHTDVSADPDALKAMFHNVNEVDLGSLDNMLSYCAAHAPNLEVEQKFNQRFDHVLQQVPEGSVLNWQDYFFAPSIIKHSDRLRQMNCHQTYHLHTTIPDSLMQSAWGQSLLRAVSKVDCVYVHTDKYARDLESQLIAMNLKVPEIRRFDLGIDSMFIEQALAKVNQGNYTSAVPQFETLTEQQKQLVHEAMRSEGKVPHRFICVDRLDPGKGAITVLKAIDSFLEGQLASGHSLESLRKNFRFFFLQHLLSTKSSDLYNLKDQYAMFGAKLFEDLTNKYPGIVWVCDAFQGKQRLIVPALMKNMNGITGGAQDGLNLSVMEIATASKNYDSAVIVGSGAGVAIRAAEIDSLDTAFFPRAGSVSEFKNSVEQVVKLQSTSPGSLQAMNAKFVRFVEKREDTVIVS